MVKRLILTRQEILHAALIIVGIAAVLFGVSVAITRVSNGDITTAAHQAVYRLSLSRLHQGASVADVSGVMSYRIEDACDGWNVAQRFDMQFVYPDAQQGESSSALLVSDYNTFESKDGRRFQFSTRRTKDGTVTDEVLGKAERTGAGGGTIEYQRPKTLKVALPADVLFPNQHTLKILEAAAAGEKIAFVPLFDGSDTTLGADVNSIIMGAKKPYVVRVEDIAAVKTPVGLTGDDNSDADNQIPATVKPMTAAEINNSPLIKNTRAWRVRMAFYPRADAFPPEGDAPSANDADDDNILPDYEMTMILHSNGVVSSFTLDYPDFSLDADLLSINEVAKNSC